jgi:hypothetical protein
MKKTFFTIIIILITSVGIAKTVSIDSAPRNYEKIKAAKKQFDQLTKKENSLSCTVPNSDFDSWTDIILVNSHGDTIGFTTPSPWFPVACFASAIDSSTPINIEPGKIDSVNFGARIFVDSNKLGADMAVIITCDGRPTSISTMLKCSVDISSTLFIEASLNHYDADLDSTISVGYAYTELYGTLPVIDLEMNIHYFDSTTPADTIFLYFSYLHGEPGDEVIFDQVKLNFKNNGIEKEKTSDMLVYPNPASHYLNIELEEIGQKATGTITDITGKIIERINITEPKFMWSVNAFDPGIYFLKIEDEKKVYVKKFIKE